jgi:hypothetical protein
VACDGTAQELLSILPARLDDARNFSLERKSPEAETADAELPKERAGTSADLAAVMLTGFELRLLCIFDAFCGGCHIFLLSIVTANW